MKSVSEKPFNLTCWYINQRRLMELVGPATLAQRLEGYQHLDGHQRTLATFAAYKALAIDYIKSKAVEPLGTSLLHEKVVEGCLFTHYSQFWFKGLSKLYPDDKNRNSNGTASGYTKLNDFEPALRLEFSFHPEHLTSTSAWGEMSGNKRKFFFGAVQSVAPGRLTAIPYIVADPLAGSESFASAGYWLNHREIHIDSIDTFAKVADYRPRFTQKSLEDLSGHSPSSLGTIRDYDVRRALTTAMAALGAPAGAVAARSWTYVGCAAARRRAPTIVPGAPGQRRRRGVRAGEIDCV